MSDDQNAGGGDTDAGNEGGDGGGEPKYITQEDLSEVLNKAITGRVERMEKRLTKTLGETVGASITEALAALSKKPDDDTPDDKGDDKPDHKVVLMERRLQKLTEDLETSNKARELEAGKRKAEGLRGDVVSALGDLDMTGSRLKGAVSLLYAEGRVYIGEDGSHLFKDAEGIEFPLADGVKAWSSSDEAKLYMPPTNVRGSGDKNTGKPPKIFKDNSDLDKALQGALEGTRKFVMS